MSHNVSSAGRDAGTEQSSAWVVKYFVPNPH